jgi:hypothetical protein
MPTERIWLDHYMLQTEKFDIIPFTDHNGEWKVIVQRNSGEHSGEGTEMTIDEFNDHIEKIIKDM